MQEWVAEHVSSGLGETVGRLLPSDTVVRDIAVDPFDGLTGYTAGNGIPTRKTFDLAGRLTGLDIDGVERRTYGYAAGPRIRAIETTGPRSASPLKTAFTYSGFGQLVWSDETRPAERPPVRDALGRVAEDTRFRYAYTPQGQLAEVTDKASGKVVARYRYNSAGQRVAKSVFDGEGKERTTFTLWQDGHRVAEVDEKGNLTAQTLYLAEGQHATPVAQLDGDSMFAIHADQRGAPVAMTDADQKIVWRANVSPWGAATPVDGKSFGPASMNLRLPGQYYDEETGLHDNGFRTYDPASGNYLQPDPLGYPDGPDAYRYAQGDPINRVDPDGLYAIDVHYYMTYFLALTAGLDDKTAWVVATAAQTIDDVNPYTDALPHLDPWDADSALARERYHFTQTSTAWDPLNNQTSTLLGYATNADNPCLKAQLFGEFMHAYQDTFGHRDINNKPYGASLGHALDGTKPDWTYNTPLSYGWNVNEARTLLMEQYVFGQMQNFWGTSAKDANGNPITFASLEPFFKEWNALISDEMKIDELNKKLVELGFKAIKKYEKDGSEGLACRLKYFQQAGLIDASGKTTTKGKDSYYSGAILDTTTQGATTCKY